MRRAGPQAVQQYRWVGHSGLHSARGSIIGLAFVVAIVIVRLVVH